MSLHSRRALEFAESNTGAMPVTQLVANLIAGRKYIVRLCLFITYSGSGQPTLNFGAGTCSIDQFRANYRMHGIGSGVGVNSNTFDNRNTDFVSSAYGETLIEAEGTVQCSASGSFQPAFGSTGNYTLRVGSFMEVHEI